MKPSSLLITITALSAFALGAAFLGSTLAGGDEKEKKQDSGKSLVYELRTYTTEPGRLPALHKRFREHTLRLFEKHGMKNIAYWTPTNQENTLVYVIAHESEEAAKKSWQAFREDPDWQKAYKESHKDGPIVAKVVSQFLKPTDYSPIK
jgi:hypothetical protein